ncbi:MAG: hypothetical protein M3R09_07590 [Actinomycetota bacterium]|nr:hypothetical protein [Actinomycetota bacterium]
MKIILVAIVGMLVTVLLMVPGQEIETARATDDTPNGPALQKPAPQLPAPVSPQQTTAGGEQPPLPLAAAFGSRLEAARPAVRTAPVPPADVPTVIPPDADAPGRYTAMDGDTLSNVTGGLLGSDTKSNRNAVVAANPSLQADPDYVRAGKTYVLTLSPQGAVAAASQVRTEARPIPQPAAAAEAVLSDADRVLRYTAQPGDTVSTLAASLLGENSTANRDTIISHNRSLRNDPHLVVAGTTYRIHVTDGLSAVARPVSTQLSSPSAQPDADEAVRLGSGRDLRYTALAGDTVFKLAEVLLGSDTQANREAIINSNPSLKADPDRVVAGQTYWIQAPSAPAH